MASRRSGIVNYYNSSREFCLITPSGKSREHDIYSYPSGEGRLAE